ncbi:beta-galactosidase [Streptomyces sp. BK205]|uniref:beta-galactosidase n=1 Tax=Streptomyces sp. BK205 TaxID=2512164 RepID=UPI001048F197|nr:beta-galactosidase [Streptomyces sp. BK205]TCR16026.1 endo-1,4-beta-mannosidase [Streptomyces sp. BK205]
MSLTLNEGVPRREETAFRVIGAVYHPSAAGCRIWLDWDPDSIDRDLARIASCGLNSVRIFVFWRDVEPEEGHFDNVVLDRVRAFARMAGTHSLACVLSVCTIWMNGQRLDLPWRRGRSLWRDPGMLDRAEAYVTAVATAVRDLDNVLVLDLGDEIANVDPAEAATLADAEVTAWQSRLADAARKALPSVLVTQANDVSGVLGVSRFGPDHGAGLDLLSVHGWPLWSPGAIESNASYKAGQLPGFLIRYAQAYGPALLDEIGSYGVSEQVATGYLRTAGASVLAAGAVGVIAWCWQDISSRSEPYQLRPGERCVGLVRLDGTAKPRLRALRDLAALAEFCGAPVEIGLYLPELSRSAPSTYLDASATNVAAFYAHLLLQRSHLPYEAFAASAPRRDYRLVIVPSVSRLTLLDRDVLKACAEQGATVYVSVADQVHGWPDEDLAWAQPEDFRLPDGTAQELLWGTDRWTLHNECLEPRRTVVQPGRAEVLARFGDGGPACTANPVGAGQVVVCAVPFEMSLDRAGRLETEEWHGFYRRVAALAGIRPPDLPPEVESVPGHLGSSAVTLLINHGEIEVRTGCPGTTRHEPLRLPAKSWALIENGRPVSVSPATEPQEDEQWASGS